MGEYDEKGSTVMAKELLDVKQLFVNVEDKEILHGVDLKIGKGETHVLMGPNGAGKTTIFNLITGLYRPTSGTIQLMGEDITDLVTHKRVQKGIARTFQNIRLFKQLTVLENVKVAYHNNMSYGLFSSIFRTKKYWKEENEVHQKAQEILEVLGLLEYKDELAQNLPYGKQRKLEIARALATFPRLLCLDEPAAGMNPHETEELMKTIKIIQEKFETTILLIEHDMKFVMGICDRIYVLNFGELIAEGVPLEIQKNPEVIKAYLGE